MKLGSDTQEEIRQSIRRKNGKTQFKLLYERILVLSSKKGPGINPDNVWHLTTLFNSFNQRHCYDIQMVEGRDIEPVYFRFDLDVTRNGVLCRLMAVQIEEKGGVIFYFDSNQESPSDVVVRMTLKAFTLHYAKERDAIFYDGDVSQLSSETDGGDDDDDDDAYIGEHAAPVTKSKQYIKYSHLEATIGPVFADVEYDSNNKYVDTGGMYDDWVVDRKYVSKGRVFASGRIPIKSTLLLTKSITLLDQYSGDFKNLNYIKTYLYGSDPLYIEENFDDDNVYTPKTTLAVYDRRIEEVMDQHFTLNYERVIVHIHPEDVDLPIHTGGAYDEILTGQQKEKEIAWREYLGSITSITTKLESMISDGGEDRQYIRPFFKVSQLDGNVSVPDGKEAYTRHSNFIAIEREIENLSVDIVFMERFVNYVCAEVSRMLTQ